MAIRVKHAPSAAAIGESAYTIGRGEKRRWAVEAGIRKQSVDIQGMSVALQAKSRAAALEQRREEFKVRTEQDAAARSDAERIRLEEPSRQLQKGLQQQEILRKNVAWEYDEGQKREMAKITTGVAWLREQVASGKWTPEQAEEAEQKLWQKYHSIIPLPVYDDKAKPQEMYNSRIVTDPITGARSMMDGKGNFTDVPGGISFSEYSRLYADISALYTTKDIEGKIIHPDSAVVDKAVLDAITRFSQIQGLAAKAGEEQGKMDAALQGQRPAQQEQDPEAYQQQQLEMQAAVGALPEMFKRILMGKPYSPRVTEDTTPTFPEKVYDEDAYNRTLEEAVREGEKDGIPPDVIKAELDKWWDAEYQKDLEFAEQERKKQKSKGKSKRGHDIWKFNNRMDFEGPEPQSREEFIRKIQSMSDKEKAKAYYKKWVGLFR